MGRLWDGRAIDTVGILVSFGVKGVRWTGCLGLGVLFAVDSCGWWPNTCLSFILMTELMTRYRYPPPKAMLIPKKLDLVSVLQTPIVAWKTSFSSRGLSWKVAILLFLIFAIANSRSSWQHYTLLRRNQLNVCIALLRTDSALLCAHFEPLASKISRCVQKL